MGGSRVGRCRAVAARVRAAGGACWLARAFVRERVLAAGAVEGIGGNGLLRRLLCRLVSETGRTEGVSWTEE
eukprot:scaffold1500_cov200-Alexandrium_tamarense.AAC.2